MEGIYFLITKDYTIGSGPFCNAKKKDCDLEGFIAGENTNKGCWSGEKQVCRWSDNEFKQSDVYIDLVKEKGEEFANKSIPKKYYTTGTAPFCGTNAKCDLVQSGKLFVGYTNHSNGESCTSGIKAYGIDPITETHLKKIEKDRKKCQGK